MGRNHARFWATGITDSGGTTSLVYDYEDRVTSITRPGMTTNTFAYNGFGARVSKTDSAGSTTYLRNGTSVVAPVVADSQAVYTPGISERRGSASRFYHGDIKNFVEQTDSSGQIASSQEYDAFGNPVSSTGTWSGPFAYGGRFGYQSDSDTSLSLLGHRYYDPTTGRFLSRDPIGDGRNWYGYCGNNPVAFADPSGLFLLEVGAALLAITVLTVTIVKLGNMASDAREENREGEDAFQRKVEEQGLESVPVEEIDRTYRPDRKAIEEVRNEAMEELKDQYLLGPIEALHPGVEAVSNAIKLLRELLDAWRTPDPPIIDRY